MNAIVAPTRAPSADSMEMVWGGFFWRFLIRSSFKFLVRERLRSSSHLLETSPLRFRR